jgi:hypothetical protein
MTEDERIWSVREILIDYARSPSLRHIRDPHSLTRLAQASASTSASNRRTFGIHRKR